MTTASVRFLISQPFELHSSTGKLLANTAATGGAFEIMPQTNRQDALPDPPISDNSALAPNQLRLSWSTNASGYILQQNPGLEPTNWTTVTTAVSVLDTSSQISLPGQGPTGLLRLVIP